MYKIRLLLIFASLSLGACNRTKMVNKMETAATPAEPATRTYIEITGKVTAIKNGKDGYTATVETSDHNIYDATISIPNMTDPTNFRRVAVGETVTLSGEVWKMQQVNQLTVRKM